MIYSCAKRRPPSMTCPICGTRLVVARYPDQKYAWFIICDNREPFDHYEYACSEEHAKTLMTAHMLQGCLVSRLCSSAELQPC